MKLELKREEATARGVRGSLYLDGVFQCFTLERPMDDKAHPCIKAGEYEVFPWKSPRFKRYVLRFVSVPGRTDILVHVGNTIADSLGCILVGLDRLGATLIHSRLALDALLVKVTTKVAFIVTDPEA